MNALRLTLIAFCVLSLSACPSTKDPLQYKTAGAKEARLDVPPDLTTPKGDSRYTIPGGGSASANQTQTDPAKPHSYSSEILKNIKDMHIERDGKQRWLVIEGKNPAEVWPVLKVFWREMGFVIKSEEPEIGLMETDWAENRAKLPNDGLRGLLEKVGVGSVYSTPERDKFVIRLEHTSQGTEVFFSHKGLYEIYTTEKKDNTAWQPRPTDPELEAAFLARFMMRLGMSEDAAAQQLATTGTTQGVRANIVDNALILNDPFDRAWRRVGLALDRVGLTVTDRNRSDGIYFVRPALQEANIKEENPGFFSRLLGGKKKKSGTIELSKQDELRVKLTQTGKGTVSVTFLDDVGDKMTTPEVKTALSRLQTELQ